MSSVGTDLRPEHIIILSVDLAFIGEEPLGVDLYLLAAIAINELNIVIFEVNLSHI